MHPSKIYLFSGKRKCGKDYITDKLFERLDKEKVVIIKISAPIKQYWANLKGLDYQALLGSGKYKEKFRKDMLEWSEEERRKDYGIFCREAVKMIDAQEKPIWIVSDVRRRSDIRWFKENFGTTVSTIKIISDNEVRKSRGWNFEEGVDDQETECDLDCVDDWDLIINNNGSDSIEAINGIKQQIDLLLAKP